MNVFVYFGDLYCEDCGNLIRDQITDKGKEPANPNDKSSYDSDDYPKGPYPDGGGESDSPQHCGAGSECLNKLWPEAGHYVGCMLENPLDSEGEKYVIKLAKLKSNKVTQLWIDFYDLSKRLVANEEA